MIINKIYEVNMKDCDSVILDIAHDIERGFTLEKMERVPCELFVHTYNNSPTLIIKLHNTKTDGVKYR